MDAKIGGLPQRGGQPPRRRSARQCRHLVLHSSNFCDDKLETCIMIFPSGEEINPSCSLRRHVVKLRRQRRRSHIFRAPCLRSPKSFPRQYVRICLLFNIFVEIIILERNTMHFCLASSGTCLSYYNAFPRE